MSRPRPGCQGRPPATRPHPAFITLQLPAEPGLRLRDGAGEGPGLLPIESGQSVSVCLGRDPLEVKKARDAARGALSEWGLSEHAEDTAIIVSELVTNAMRHGEGPVGLCIRTNGSRLHVEVHDDGPGRPVRRAVTADDESGHGLELIDGLLKEQGGSRQVVSDKAGAGKTVQVTIGLASPR